MKDFINFNILTIVLKLIDNPQLFTLSELKKQGFEVCEIQDEF